MYRLSLSGTVLVVGLVLWFRPVLGLLVFQRYRGAPDSGTHSRIRERIVLFVAGACIVVAVAAATLILLW